MYGCASCVWKACDQCPMHLSGDEVLPEGFCKDYIGFMLSKGEGSNSKAVMLERWHIYMLELQTTAEFNELQRIQRRLADAKARKGLTKEELFAMEADKDTAKLLWLRMNESVTKALSRVTDREARIASDTMPKLTIQQLNFQIQHAATKFLELESGKPDKGDTMVEEGENHG